MKKSNFDKYELFYEEIPHTDYFGDIEIQDEAENPTPDKPRGLSEDQVTELARDSLRDSIQNDKKNQSKSIDEQSLLSSQKTV